MEQWKQALREVGHRRTRQRLVRAVLRFVWMGATLWLMLAVMGYAGVENLPWRKGLFVTAIVSGVALLSGVLAPSFWQWLSHRMRASWREWAGWAGERNLDLAETSQNLMDLDALTQRDGLVEQAIAERGQQLSSHPWKREFRLSELRREALWLALPFGIVLTLVVSGKGEVLRKGSESVVAYNRVLAPPPFVFESIEVDKDLVEGVSTEVKVALAGRALPDRLWMSVDGVGKVPLKRIDREHFSADWTPIQGVHAIRVYSESVESEALEVDVFGASGLWVDAVELRFPSYTGIGSRKSSFENQMVVPRGTMIRWRVQSRNTEGVRVVFDAGEERKAVNPESWFAGQSGRVVFEWKNREGGWVEAAFQDVEVVPDVRPRLEVEELRNRDSARYNMRFVDDYGFRGVYVEYETEQGINERILLAQPKGTEGGLVWTALLEDLSVRGIRALQFVAADNDALSGYKETRSARFAFEAVEDLERLEQASTALGSWSGAARKSEKTLSEAERVEEGLKMERASALDWKQRNAVEQQRKSIEQDRKARSERVSEMAKALEEIDKTRDPSERDEALRKELNEAAQRMDAQLKKEEMERAKERASELLKKLSEERTKAAEERMTEERLLELLKREAVDAQFGALREEYRALAEAQEKLAQEHSEGEAERQAVLEEQLDALNQAYDKMLEENRSLEQPFAMDEMKSSRSEAEAKMNKAKEQTGKQPEMEQKAQKESAESLQKLAEEMDAMSAEMESQGQAENIEDVVQILDNLLYYSRGQEALSYQLAAMNPADPGLSALMVELQKLIEGSAIIQDSLQALAKRTPLVGQKIFDELKKMDRAGNRASGEMAERELGKASSSTRYAMTAANELAVLLDQSLQNMQSMMMSSSGKGSCNKPGGSKPSPGQSNKPSPAKMSELQKELMKGMEGVKGKEGEKGKKEGEKGQGGKEGKNGREGISRRGGQEQAREFAELLRQQEELRRMLESLMESEEAGMSGSQGQKMLEMMKESERELAEQLLSPRALIRQQEIQSRLLESERAERSRGEDDRRESESGGQRQEQSGPWSPQERVKLEEIERLQLDPIRFSPYYQQRILQWQSGT